MEKQRPRGESGFSSQNAWKQGRVGGCKGTGGLWSRESIREGERQQKKQFRVYVDPVSFLLIHTRWIRCLRAVDGELMGSEKYAGKRETRCERATAKNGVALLLLWEILLCTYIQNCKHRSGLD